MTVTPPPPIPLSPLHPPPPNPSDPQPTKTAKTCKLEQGELAHDQSSFPFSHTKKIFVTQPHNSHFIELLTQIFTTASCPYKMQKNLKPIREIVPAFFGNRGETSSQLSFTQQYLKTVEFVQVEHLSSKQTTTNASYYTYYCLNINRQHHDHLHLDLLTISNNNIFIVTVTVIIAQPFDTDSCQVYYRGQCCQHLHISEHFARSQLHCYGNDDWGHDDAYGDGDDDWGHTLSVCRLRLPSSVGSIGLAKPDECMWISKKEKQCGEQSGENEHVNQ